MPGDSAPAALPVPLPPFVELTASVRNKAVEAYQDVMRMQI